MATTITFSTNATLTNERFTQYILSPVGCRPWASRRDPPVYRDEGYLGNRVEVRPIDAFVLQGICFFRRWLLIHFSYNFLFTRAIAQGDSGALNTVRKPQYLQELLKLVFDAVFIHARACLLIIRTMKASKPVSRSHGKISRSQMSSFVCPVFDIHQLIWKVGDFYSLEFAKYCAV